MKTSVRSHLTAGLAVVGAGAIALTPVSPVMQSAGLSAHRVDALAVQLSSSIDPITPWVNTIVGAIDNIGGLASEALGNPFPILQQVIGNQLTYLGELPDIGTILGQVFGNVGNFVGAPFVETPLAINPADSGETTGAIAGPIDHFTFYVLTVSEGNIGLLTPAQIAQIKPIFDLLTMPATGVALGLAGPVIAPVLALVDSVGAIVSALGSADIIGAINELINIPANLTNAFLNGGQFLDLAPLAQLVGLELPSIITSFGLTVGGLLSQGAWTDTTRGDYFPSTGPGVAFDALALQAAVTTPLPVGVNLEGLPLGPIGTLIGMGNSFAKAITVTPPNSAQAAPAPAASEQSAETAAPAAEVATAEVAAEAPAAEAAPVAVTAVDAHEDTSAAAPAADDAKAPTRGSSRASANRGSAAESATADTGERPSGGRGTAARRAG